jgi:hypothetical protein
VQVNFTKRSNGYLFDAIYISNVAYSFRALFLIRIVGFEIQLMNQK